MSITARGLPAAQIRVVKAARARPAITRSISASAEAPELFLGRPALFWASEGWRVALLLRGESGEAYEMIMAGGSRGGAAAGGSSGAVGRW